MEPLWRITATLDSKISVFFIYESSNTICRDILLKEIYHCCHPGYVSKWFSYIVILVLTAICQLDGFNLYWQCHKD